jgi:uncharacterized protein
MASGALLMALRPAPARADFQRGVEEYQRGDCAAAFRESLPAGQQGDAQAAHALGPTCLTARGVDRDNAQAIEWYRRIAERGFSHGPPPQGGG